MEHTLPIIKNSVLDDYHYSYIRGNQAQGLVALGMTMFYNHDREPNVEYTSRIGKDPSNSNPESTYAVGFFARRDIAKGEELFSSYGIKDDGAQWFASRQMEMMVPTKESSRIAPEHMDQYQRDFCSKMYAGIGLSTYQNRIQPDPTRYMFQTKRLPPNDAPAAIAKIHIESGERIEIAPALVLSRRFVENTVLSPLCFYWEDLAEQHHDSLIALREAGQFKVQYQSPFTEWRRVDRFEGFETSVIFPAGGFIGMVERVGTDNPNCRMEIKPSGSGAGSVGLVLEVIALTNIEAGEVLRLNISPTGSVSERLKLAKVLEITGQPISDTLQKVKRDENDGEL